MLLSILAFLWLFLLFFASAWWYLSVPKNLPPGPLGLPILGSMLDTRKSFNLHKKLHDWTKLYGPLYKFYVVDKLVVILGSWEMIQEALVKNGDAYAGRPEMQVTASNGCQPGLGLIHSEGLLWKIQRKFAISTMREFGVGRPLMETVITEETKHLVQAFQEQKGEKFDPAAFLNNALANVLCVIIFGKRFSYDNRDFQRFLCNRIPRTDISFLSPQVFVPKIAKLLSLVSRAKEFSSLAEEMADFVRLQIAEATKNFNPSTDEPTNYVQAFNKAQLERQEDETFTDEQLLTSVKDLFIAGTGTPATTLHWAVFYLAHYPEWQEKIFQEIQNQTGDSLAKYEDRVNMPLTQATIMEIQRMSNLLPFGVRRRTMVDTKLCGFDIPKDTVVVPLLTAVFRNPIIYPEPDKFDPNRFLKSEDVGEKDTKVTHFIPFQAGKRICLGESMAKIELFLVITSLVGHFKFSFPADEPMPPVDCGDISFVHIPPKFSICAVSRTDNK